MFRPASHLVVTVFSAAPSHGGANPVAELSTFLDVLSRIAANKNSNNNEKKYYTNGFSNEMRIVEINDFEVASIGGGNE